MKEQFPFMKKEAEIIVIFGTDEILTHSRNVILCGEYFTIENKNVRYVIHKTQFKFKEVMK